MDRSKKSKQDIKENRKIGKNLKRFRKEQKWTQAEMGKILKVDQSAISRLELGLQDLTMVHFFRLSQHLGCHPQDLVLTICAPLFSDRPKG